MSVIRSFQHRLACTASAIALLAAGAASALAADYTATDDTTLRNDITTANGDGSASSIITLGSNVTLAPTALPVVTKPITIDSGSFTFLKTYVAGNANAGVISLNGAATGTLTIKGTITGVAGSGNAAGQSGLNISGAASVINYATITTGNGSGNLGSGIAFTLQNGANLTNYGTATVGSATGAFGGAGAFMTGATLINNGTIQAGTGSAGGGAGITTLVSASTITNGGIIRGGNGTAGNGGTGTALSLGSSLANNVGATIQGGDGTTTGGVGVNASGVSAAQPATVSNSGTIIGGNGGTGAGGSGASVTNFTNLTNSGTIMGGNSSANVGGTGVLLRGGSTLTNTGLIKGGNGATGAVGVDLGGPGATSFLTNNGTILGTAQAGLWVRNGAGLVINGGTIQGGTGFAAIVDNSLPALSIVNSGAITAGAGYANAIEMSGATQTLSLELHKGSAITGAVAGNSGVTNTLTLGGDDNASFDVSTVGPQYQNFTVYQKTGNSVWTLTGTGSVATPWTISQGTLAIGDSTSVIGDIADNATLAFSNSNALTFANVITGTGGVNQTGSGRTNLTGASSYSGPTTISGGTLAVNGSITSAVTVASGGTLGGNGTVGATTIQSGGAVAPGNSIGTLHVSGAFVQNAGSTYQVEVDPSSSAADLIAVNGTATIQNGAGLNVIQNPAGEYQVGTIYKVLTASGGVTGTYSLSGQTSSASAFLGLKDSYDSNNVYLTVVQTRDPATAATTPNQAATAQGVDSLPASNSVATGVLNSTSDAAARSAFDQLSGQVQASAQGALLANGLYVRDVAFDRLRNVICAPVATRTDACTGRQLSIWGQGFGGWGGISGNGNAAGLNHSMAGMLAGVDVPVAGWRVGIFGGFSHADFNLAGNSAVGGSDDYHLGIYGGTMVDGVAVRLGASYSFDGITTDRAVAFGSFSDQLHGLYSGGTTQAFGEVGYGVDLSDIALEPFANLAYASLHTAGFSEAGGPAALTVKADTIDNTTTTLGVRPSFATALAGFDVTLRGMAGWRHTFGQVTPDAQVAFAGGSSFGVSGAPLARDAGAVEAGIDVAIRQDVTFGLTYGGQFSGRTTDQTGWGSVRVDF